MLASCHGDMWPSPAARGRDRLLERREDEFLWLSGGLPVLEAGAVGTGVLSLWL